MDFLPAPAGGGFPLPFYVAPIPCPSIGCSYPPYSTLLLDGIVDYIIWFLASFSLISINR